MQTLDFTPLTRKILLAERFALSHFKNTVALCAVGFVLILSVIFFLLVGTDDFAGFIISFIFGVMLCSAFIYNAYQRSTRLIRLNEFAAKNNMRYEIDKPFEGRFGVIFQEGHSKIYRDLLTAQSQAFSEIGNFEYTTGSGKNQTTHDYGFVKIKLPRRLPHMLLDSKENNFFGMLSNLPISFGGDQKLELEGDFNNYFTLYAPEQYKTDAFYVFTPDVMQALVDAVHEYDCEVIDDDFYIYSAKPLDLTSQSQFEDILNIASKLRAELIEQTDYYADERVGDRTLNVVAHEGRRLKRRLSTRTILSLLMVAVIVLFQLYIHVSSWSNP